MRKLMRSLPLLGCLGVLSASFGCVATRTHESTGQYVDDSVITTKVKAAIFNDTSLKMLQINVKTYKAQAQLSGFVDSARSAALAGEIAGRVEGVASVQNDLLVK